MNLEEKYYQKEPFELKKIDPSNFEKFSFGRFERVQGIREVAQI